jgi:hypothetical protein
MHRAISGILWPVGINTFSRMPYFMGSCQQVFVSKVSCMDRIPPE